MPDTPDHSISPDHPSLAGHFPGHPVVPGVVLLTEVQAALTAKLGRACYISGIRAVKFSRPLLPGQVFSIELELASPGEARFFIYHQEQVIAGGSITYSPAGESS